MISLNGFVHRDELTAIIGRLIVHRQEPADGRRLKAISNYNAYLGRMYLDEFTRALFAQLHGQPIHSFTASTKGQLKDFVVRNPPRRSPRIEQILDRYHRFPEDFFRETPFDGRIYHLGGEAMQYVGSTRIKRFRRIAEKMSRRIVDSVFHEIKANADVLAVERASRLGIPKEHLITPSEDQIAEFAHAERRVLKAIRNGTFNPPVLHINDVLGVKVVVDDEQRVLDAIERDPRSTLIEREPHRGAYNATNLIVKYRWPRELLTERPPEAQAREILVRRGLPAGEIESGFYEFLRSAEDEVCIEVILANYDEMLESEVGRCMHEERVLTQRNAQQYHSPLAKNIEYLMIYALLFCLSPQEDLGEVPFKLWIKHMPDYMDQVLLRLFGFSPEAEFTRLV